jgi:RNA polymerase sigma-70 factor (ECF subfamily)
MESATGALRNPHTTAVGTVTRSSSAEERLRAVACELGRDRLDLLDRVWDLCADDLYGLALWRTGSVEDAEDAVQEVFVRLARAPQRLRKARRPRAYLLKMTHNAALDVIRRRRPTETIADETEFVVAEPAMDEQVDAARVAGLIKNLPAPQREAVYLRHLLELSFRDVAAVCGVPLFTAASRYRLGIRRLRILLGVDA